jgi:hypothetical protein
MVAASQGSSGGCEKKPVRIMPGGQKPKALSSIYHTRIIFDKSFCIYGCRAKLHEWITRDFGPPAASENRLNPSTCNL